MPARRTRPRAARPIDGARRAERTRETKETRISVRIDLDGRGAHDVATGLPFLDHMLELVAVHGLFDLFVRAEGDLEVDQHHTVEDLGLTLGSTIDAALGDRRGIVRYASITIPMDECLVAVALDLGGRPYFASDLVPSTRIVGSFDTTLVPDFLSALTQSARCALHLRQLTGGNTHHLLEAAFKGIGRALDAATIRDPRRSDVPSSKGRI